MADPAQLGEHLLKALHLGAEDERARAQYTVKRRTELIGDWRV